MRSGAAATTELQASGEDVWVKVVDERLEKAERGSFLFDRKKAPG